MKKEINYLSLPDHFNKFLLINFNQKIDLKDNIILQFSLSNKYHLGFAIKAIYLLEVIFPKKSFVLKLKLRKKKIFFGQKLKTDIFFKFNMTLSVVEFIELFQFFSISPFFFKKITNFLVINRKLKQFNFNKNIIFLQKNNKLSYFFLTNYHLN